MSNISLTDKIRNILSANIPYVRILNSARIEPLRNTWPCAYVSKISDSERKGARVSRHSIDLFTVRESDSNSLEIAINNVLTTKGFFRETAFDKPETLSCTKRLIYSFITQSNHHPFDITYKSGDQFIELSSDENAAPLFGIIETHGLFPILQNTSKPVLSAAYSEPEPARPSDLKTNLILLGSKLTTTLNSLSLGKPLPREITIVGIIRNSYADAKRFLQNVVTPVKPGELVVAGKRLKCHVTKSPDFYEDSASFFKFTLIAPDPFFEDDKPIPPITLAGFTPGISFPLIITSKFEFGRRRADGYFNVVNDGHIPIGLNIRIIAKDKVRNPVVESNRTGQSLKLNLTLEKDDEIDISTEENYKTVSLISNGVVSNAMPYLEPESSFIKLMEGDNYMKVSSDSGTLRLEAVAVVRRRYAYV